MTHLVQPHTHSLARRLARGVWSIGQQIGSTLGALLAFAAASLACGLYVVPQGFLLFAGSAAVLAVGLAWPWVAVRGVSGSVRYGSRRVHEGESASLEIVLRNRWPWPAWGLEVVHGVADGDQRSTAIAQLGGWSTARFSASVVPVQRGRYPQTSPLAATSFPFGLWKAKRQLPVEGSLIVWPATQKLEGLGEQRSWSLGSQRCSERRSGNDGDRLGVREYRWGDTPRMIHWPLSARQETLVVCERQAVTHTRVLIEGVFAGGGDAPNAVNSSREWIIRVVASCGQALLLADHPICCRLGDAEIAVETGRRGRTLFLDWLATFDAQRHDAVPRRRGPQRKSQRDVVGIRIVVTNVDTQSLNKPASPDLAFHVDPTRFDADGTPTLAGPRLEGTTSGTGSSRIVQLTAPSTARRDVAAGWRRWVKEGRRG